MRPPPGFSSWTAVLVGVIAAGSLLATALGTRWQQRRGVERDVAVRRSAGWSAVVGSLLAIPLLTLQPTGGQQLPASWVPLRGTAEVWRLSGDPLVVARILGLNIALFVPLGAGVALLRPGLVRAAVVGASVSTVVEVLQLVLPTGRVTDIDDVLLNTAGAVIGAAAVAAMRSRPG